MLRIKGFTLIELLIVITIIAILSAIGLVSYTSFVKNARDAKRKSDLNFIQSALEQYHADQKYYPVAASPDEKGCASYENGTLKLRCPLKSPDGSKVYLSEVPTDPLPNRHYCYEIDVPTCDFVKKECKSYNLLAMLESKPVDNSMTCYGSGAGGSDDDGFNLKVTRP